MAVKFSNNAKTTLSSGITSSATSIAVGDASAWPTLGGGDYSLCTLITAADADVLEIVKVTAISGNTLTVVRAQEGTTARAFSSADKAELRITAGLLEQALTGTDVVKLDSLTASATASYSMAVGGVAYSPSNVNALIVSLNGVTQEPDDAFTISGSTLTFSSALTSADSIDYIVDLAKTLDIGEPSDNTVSPVKLTSAVNLDAITDNGATTTNAVTVGDLTSNGTVEFDGLSGTGAVTVTNILDQDDMSSNSATALATQQSIKAYVDAQVDTADALPEVLSNGNTTGGTNIAVSSGDNITFADSAKAAFGAGSDLQISHNGTHSFVDNLTGNLNIRNLADNADIGLRTDDGSGNHVLYLLADGSDGSTKLYHYGSQKFQTSSSGIDVTGLMEADTGRIARPSTFWASEYVGINNYGSIASQGNYDLHITSNGYRNSSGTWTSFGLNGKTGAAQLALDPDGEIGFNTNATKASGTGTGVTRRMTLSDSELDVDVGITASGFIRSNGELRSGTDVIAGRQSLGATGGEVGLTINDGYGNANVTFNHTGGVPDQDGNSARIVVNTDSTTNSSIIFQTKSGVTGGSAVNAGQRFKIDDAGVEVTGETHTDTLDVRKDVTQTVIATMENPNASAGHVLKLTTGGGGTGTKIFEAVGGSGDAFEILGNGDVNIDGNITDVGSITSRSTFRGTTTTGSGTPTFSFNGDTNTGMYHVSADHLGFTTGGTTRCIMDSLSNIGFGVDPTTMGSYKVVELKSTHADAGGYIRLQGTTGTTRASLFNYQSTMYLESHGGSFSFRDNSANIKALISTAGITIKGSSAPVFKAISNANANYSAGLFVQYQEESMSLRGGNDYKILATDGYSIPNNIKFYASNQELMRLKDNGYLGINETNPQHRLDIQGASSGINIDGGGTNPYINLCEAGDTGFRIEYDGAGSNDLKIKSGFSGNYNTVRLTLDRDNGNLGVGEGNPQAKLDVSSGATLSQATYNGQIKTGVYSTNGNLDSGVEWQVRGDGAGWGFRAININAGGGNQWRLQSRDNSASWTDCLVVDDQNVSIGKTNMAASTSGLSVLGTSTNAATASLNVSTRNNTNNTSNILVNFRRGGTVNTSGTASGAIAVNGTSQAAFVNYSDVRLKENIEDLPSQLENIKSLRPCEFDYKDGSGHQIGFIAQEMQEVYSDCVGEDEEGFLTIGGWNKTEARLVKAIQEQQEIIESLTQRLEQLEAN